VPFVVKTFAGRASCQWLVDRDRGGQLGRHLHATDATRAIHLGDALVAPWYHGGVTRWAVPVVAALGLAAGLVYWLERGPQGAELLYGERIPAWQIFRSQELRKQDSPAARAMLRAARPWPALATALRELDRLYPDDVVAAAARVNQTARSAGVPFWLDVQTVKSRGVVLCYRIEGIHAWRSGDRTVEILRLSRVDRLNVELGILGQATSNGPLVFLDRIEDDWAEQLAATSRTDREGVEAALDEQLLALARTRGQRELPKLVTALGERRARFEAMQNRMHVVVPRPSGLVWSEAWFAAIERLTKFQQGRGPLVFDSDLRAVRQANQTLDRPEFRVAFAALLELRAGGVEAHEARHAVDDPSPALPAFLHSFGNPAFAVQINQELRAYLGELHDAPAGPCLSLLGLLRASYVAKARPTPHWFAGRLIARTLGADAAALAKLRAADSDSPPAFDEILPDVDVAALARTQCAAAPAAVRDQVALLWRTFYGGEMPPLSRKQ
jgi:hypothetical protein